MSEQIDRRRSPRIRCDLPVEYKLRGGRLKQGRMTNLGIGGMLLTTEGPTPPIGADLLFRFRLPPGTRRVQAVGSVRWTTLGRAGVAFVTLNPWEQDEIGNFCANEVARRRTVRREDDPSSTPAA